MALQLRMRMQEKKKLNAKREAEDAKANESIRRKGGQDQVATSRTRSLVPRLTHIPRSPVADQGRPRSQGSEQGRHPAQEGSVVFPHAPSTSLTPLSDPQTSSTTPKPKLPFAPRSKPTSALAPTRPHAKRRCVMGTLLPPSPLTPRPLRGPPRPGRRRSTRRRGCRFACLEEDSR